MKQLQEINKISEDSESSLKRTLIEHNDEIVTLKMDYDVLSTKHNALVLKYDALHHLHTHKPANIVKKSIHNKSIYTYSINSNLKKKLRKNH